MAALMLLPACGQGAGVMDDGLSVAIDALEPGGRAPVIARFAPRSDPRPPRIHELLQDSDASMQRLRPVLERHGVRVVSPLWMIHGVAFSGDAAAIRAVAAHAEVVKVSIDRTFRPGMDAAPVRGPAPGTPSWNLDAIRAPAAWAAGFTGDGAVVALLDTGVDQRHPDLAARWRGGANSWFDPFGEHAVPYDADGHGTRVAGLMIGGDASGAPIGVAPGARWIAAKIFDDEGTASLSAIHRAFQWALDPDGDPATDDAPDVVNNSWGMRGLVDECDAEFQPDIDALRAAGIAVVFAAGDEGPGAPSSLSPANGAGALSVGSVDSARSIESDSSRGPSACSGGVFPLLVAPGVSVRTSDLTYGGAFPRSYAGVTGTSFAAPHIAGAFAILRAAAPWASLDEIEKALQDSARDLGDAGADAAFGHGLVDVAAALARIPAPAAFPMNPARFVHAPGTLLGEWHGAAGGRSAGGSP